MSQSRCGSHFVVLRKKLGSSFLFGFFPVLCKSWACEYCRKLKASLIRNYVKENFKEEDLWMLTFTLFHSGDEAFSWKKIAKGWNLFRTYATKLHGKFSYLRIIEPHKKSGYPHMHVLVNKFVCDQAVLKKLVRWGFGWNFESQRISQKSALGYVTKYLTKGWDNVDAEELRQATKARIVSVSRDLPPLFFKTPSWELCKHSVPSEHAHFIHSVAITQLHFHGASFVDSAPLCGGFVIRSDVEVDPFAIFDSDVPYSWDWCDDHEFYYLYGVCQEELFPEDSFETLTRSPQNYSESSLSRNLIRYGL